MKESRDILDVVGHVGEAIACMVIVLMQRLGSNQVQFTQEELEAAGRLADGHKVKVHFIGELPNKMDCISVEIQPLAAEPEQVA